MRLAHRGKVVVDGVSEDMVIKFSKAESLNRQLCFKDAEMQAIARAWARRFNELEPTPSPTISFVPSYVLELVDRPGRPVCGCEPFIDGVFQKHNNNVGAAVAQVTRDGSEDYSATAQAFRCACVVCLAHRRSEFAHQMCI